MKKYLLIMAAALSVAGANAQNVPSVKVNASSDYQMATTATKDDANKMEVSNLSQYRHNLMTVAPASATATTSQKGMRKSYANGIYYNRPAGTMYQHFTSDGYGYYNSELMFPSFCDVTFVDESKKKALSAWLLGSNDFSDYKEDDGSFIWSQQPLATGYSYPVLTLKNGTSSYQLSEKGRNYSNYPTRMTSTTDITPLGFNDDHAAEAAYYGWSGRNQKHYLFGTGEYTDEESGNLVKMFAIEQDFEAPAGPLYVESIDIPAYSFTLGTPIPEGTVLKMKVMNTETQEVIAELTCTEFFYSYDGDEPYAYDTDYGNLYDGYIHFAAKSVDAFGTEIEEPVVIDCAFTISAEGFDQEGVDVGFGAYKNYDPDVAEPTYNVCYDTVTGDITGFSYQTPFCVGMTFNGLFDTVKNYGDVEATDGETYPTYYVKIEDDGTASSNAVFSDIDGALVYVGTPWFTEEGDEMYGAALPDWIQGMSATAYSEPEEGEIASQYVINFTADPLPSNVKGRGVFVYIEGRGVTIDTPIFAFQGDIEAAWEDAMAAGVEFVTVDPMTVKNGKTYNVAGQIVNDNFKGIVIKNGKKYMK